MRVTVLGCGASGGVPNIGCDCAICTSGNPKNIRTRSSILIENKDSKVLVDLSPDLRQQALRHTITTVDAIIVTHGHADHCHGIDDTRTFNYHRKGPIPLYSDQATLDRLQAGFSYVFTPHHPGKPWYKPELTPHLIDVTSYDTFTPAAHVDIKPFLQWHGKMKNIGLKVGNFAYSTDVNNLPEESLQLLENIDVWVVDCLRYQPAPSHAHLDMTLEWIRRVKPKRAILTHMNHDMDYDFLLKTLPPNIEPAYDGMVIELD